VLRTFTAADWIENLRVSKETFLCLSFNNRIPGFIKPSALVITSWGSATCGEYRTIGQLFGIARYTVCHCS